MAANTPPAAAGMARLPAALSLSSVADDSAPLADEDGDPEVVEEAESVAEVSESSLAVAEEEPEVREALPLEEVAETVELEEEELVP